MENGTNIEYGDGGEQHLPKIPGMLIFADFFLGNMPWPGQPTDKVWPSYSGPGFDAPWTVANLLLRDRDKQAALFVVTFNCVIPLPPGDPKLHGMFEAQLAGQPVCLSTM
jgi:hypothetical protein